MSDYAMTREDYDNEANCATCGRPLGTHVIRNRKGQLVHRDCTQHQPAT